MKRKQGQILTAVLVDYDNIYLSLRRKSEEAARRFAKDAGLWLKEIESGQLITPTNSVFGNVNRRIVLNRCYGNPVPRRNTHDNSTDMNSFPFVRHHFLRSGFEVVDCPPLTAQLKNSSDIRMVMDVRDFLLHDTYFDEFIILSGDADFTPVLHRLRAHARRTVIFANDHTAVPYKAISDGEVREADLIRILTEGIQQAPAEPVIAAAPAAPRIEDQRQIILDEVLGAVRASRHPIPIDLLAERAVKLLGADKTIATGWAGAGSLRELISQANQDGIRIGDQPPYFVFDLSRRITSTASEPLALPETAPAPAAPALAAEPLSAAAPEAAPASLQQRELRIDPQLDFPGTPLIPVAEPFGSAFRPTAAQVPPPVMPPQQPAMRTPQPLVPSAPQQQAQQRPAFQLPSFENIGAPIQQPARGLDLPFAAPQAPRQPDAASKPMPPPIGQPIATNAQQPVNPQMGQPTRAPSVATATALQQSIARIHEACQAPPLSPPEYRVLFDAMAREIQEKGLTGAQTLTNIGQRAREQGVEVRKDDIRFVLEVVSETDPWFEQGASPTLFAGRFRNFVVARCRSQGLHLTADELDLIEAWFVADAPQSAAGASQQPYASRQTFAPQSAPGQQAQPAAYQYGQAYAGAAAAAPAPSLDDEFPRIVRTRLRG